MVFPAPSPWERGLGYIHFISLPRARCPQLHLRGQGGGGFADGEIIRRCQTPRDVIVAIRHIQAATAWCEARVEGLERYNQQGVR